MRKPNNKSSGLQTSGDNSSAIPSWLATLLAAFILAAVALLDYVTGKTMSFTLLYLAPISVALWFVGRRTGLLFCAIAAATGFAIELSDQSALPAALWNLGVRFGVYVLFYILLDYLKEHDLGIPSIGRAQRTIALGVGLVGVLVVAIGLVERQLPVKASASKDASKSSVSDNPLVEIAALLNQSMQASRPVLLGSRDPNGPSCVQVAHTGDIKDTVPNNPGDLNGGPGTTMATIYYFDRTDVKSPMQDFTWHQHRLKQFLENEQNVNRPAAELAHEFSEQARQFWETASNWTELPAKVAATGFNQTDDWPSYCLTQLDKGVANEDLSAVKHWAGELAQAAFSLDDLHRWLGFLVENHLTGLEFQARCEALFSAAEALHHDYNPDGSISQFPAGVLGINGKGNYYEVERQAEQLFSMPAGRFAALADDDNLSPASLWVPPTLRECFMKLERALGDSNRANWEVAARTPYQHAYLVNMLYRATNADTADELYQVLRKFDAVNPHGSVGELMNVLMYRGHSFAGLEWGDRFQPELIRAADQINPSETDLEALQDACKWTNHFYQSPAEYGVTFTLRGALEEKKLDCVRATDMISAIFRNAGRSRLGHVRWCSETGGHSVAAYWGRSDDKDNFDIELVDGLMPPQAPEKWPDCYFHGHAWPPGLEKNAQPYAVEMYVRGLDSYIWADGYIVRGPNAGWLTTAAIPYSAHQQEQTTRKVYDGPYPE